MWIVFNSGKEVVVANGWGPNFVVNLAVAMVLGTVCEVPRDTELVPDSGG